MQFNQLPLSRFLLITLLSSAVGCMVDETSSTEPSMSSVTSGTGGSSSSGDGGSPTGGAGSGSGGAAGGSRQSFTVSGAVSRSADIAPGNDGVGVLYVAAFDKCDLATAVLLGASVTADADFSAPDAMLPFSIAGLAGGTIQFASFFDDNENATPPAARPDSGDLVFADNVRDGKLTCLAVAIDGADVSDVPITLNAVED
jgi:hypothetical protein